MKTMRPQRAILPLAFLSAAFMLGCQDSTTNPLTPDSTPVQFAKGGIPGPPGGGGGDGPGSERQVTIEGGLLATDQPVQVDSDNKKKFVISASAFTGEINLTGTEAAGIGACGITDGGESTLLAVELFNRLTDPLGPRKFIMRFDRSDRAGFNQIVYQWGDQFALYVGSVPKKGVETIPGVGGVETDAVESPPGTFTFSAGEVRLNHAFGEQRSSIRCPLADEVTLVVNG